ncbi:hypothetical protein Cyast_2099 [Cyanobacterium stanieri PCC 7202]|uniref:Uncharacterized protein n=1 Tax=Cyanobacterium stanieri (strain ATCC 29140 / PCC 7202) TaxID=292563 RepID=K9YME9_CYASC|nr:hypothetical protein Cyast_2099 [Cyanobacterium stanieri PCC 7202]
MLRIVKKIVFLLTLMVIFVYHESVYKIMEICAFFEIKDYISIV